MHHWCLRTRLEADQGSQLTPPFSSSNCHCVSLRTTLTLAEPPPYPRTKHTGPRAAILNAPASVSSKTYTQYKSTYYALDNYCALHGITATSQAIADFIQSSPSTHTAQQRLSHLRLFATMELIPLPTKLASTAAKAITRFCAAPSPATQTALIPSGDLKHILTPPHNASQNVIRLAAHVATGTRCKEICSITSDNITYPCNLFVPPSKRRPAVTIALTPLARSLLARLTTTTPTEQYQSWIKHNYPFTGKSCRRSFASAQNFMGILPSRIGTVLRHKDSKTTLIHYIFPYPGLSYTSVPPHFMISS